MTYSNSGSQRPSQNPSPFTPDPADTNRIYTAAIAPVVRAAMAVMWVWVQRVAAAQARAERTGCPRDRLISKLIMMMFAVILTRLTGSNADKAAMLERMFMKVHAKRRKRLQDLYAKYLVWRQRKCWMWSGGFMSRALAAVPDVYVAAHDQKSFDALIPD
jgi:hypothetical protein